MTQLERNIVLTILIIIITTGTIYAIRTYHNLEHFIENYQEQCAIELKNLEESKE